METILKVNINGNITQLTRDELDRYLYEFPEYKETYYIIEEIGKQ